MLSDSGVKLYLSSGMASAASTSCLSLALTWRSAMLAKVGGVCTGWGEACACGAGVAGLAAGAAPCPWLTVPTAKLRMASRQNILIYFIGTLLLQSQATEKDITGASSHATSDCHKKNAETFA